MKQVVIRECRQCYKGSCDGQRLEKSKVDMFNRPSVVLGGEEKQHMALFSVSALLLVSALVFLICLVGFKLFLYYSFFLSARL